MCYVIRSTFTVILISKVPFTSKVLWSNIILLLTIWGRLNRFPNLPWASVYSSIKWEGWTRTMVCNLGWTLPCLGRFKKYWYCYLGPFPGILIWLICGQAWAPGLPKVLQVFLRGSQDWNPLNQMRSRPSPISDILSLNVICIFFFGWGYWGTERLNDCQ